MSLKEYFVIQLTNSNHDELIKEMTTVFGTTGENWFIYNGNLYIRDNKTYTWFMLKYG